MTPRQPPVLALRALGLGDLLTGVPALRALRRAVSPRPLVLAAPAALGRWFVELGVVDDVVPTRDLDDVPPGSDLGEHDAVDLHGNGPASRDLLAVAQPRRLLSYAPPSPLAWDAAEHEVDRWLRLVAVWGAAGSRAELLLAGTGAPSYGPIGTGCPCASEGARRPDLAVVHPGAAFESRRWPARRWAAVAASLHRAGWDVVVTAGPGELELATTVARAAGLDERALRAGPELAELAALVGSAGLLLCGDTGVAHLATALATPSVLLFGPVSPAVWGPAIDLDRHLVLWRGDGHGDPHGRHVDPHLLLIEPDEVLAAVEALTGAARAAAPSAVPAQALSASTERNHDTVRSSPSAQVT